MEMSHPAEPSLALNHIGNTINLPTPGGSLSAADP